MYDNNQIIQMKWGSKNKRHYESKGYMFTKIGDVFDVYVKDLSLKSHAKISVVCDYCGEEYIAQIDNVTKSRKTINKDACTKCKYKKNSDVMQYKNAIRLLGSARELCEKNGYILLTTEQEYTGSHMTIRINCKEHGEQNVSLWAFLNGAMCPKCARKIVANKNTLNVDDVKLYIDSINGNVLLNKEDYKTRKTSNLKIRCACGNIYTTSFGSYILGTQQCYSCSCKESSGERRIRMFLESNDILFIKEKKFDNCCDKQPLPFDFYLPSQNTIIEFDGRHHYEQVYNYEQHIKTVEHDKIKNEYCQLHGINLVRIPYWEENNIEVIIVDKLNL